MAKSTKTVQRARRPRNDSHHHGDTSAKSVKSPRANIDEPPEVAMSIEEMMAAGDELWGTIPKSTARKAVEARRQPSRYELSEISPFDARRGYRRCDPPGVGVSDDTQSATADIWRDRTGKVVARFYSLGYVFHMEAVLSSGKNIREDQMEDFSHWLGDVLLEWIIDGVDDTPEPGF